MRAGIKDQRNMEEKSAHIPNLPRLTEGGQYTTEMTHP
jgi:hypothetical protein